MHSDYVCNLTMSSLCLIHTKEQCMFSLQSDNYQLSINPASKPVPQVLSVNI